MRAKDVTMLDLINVGEYLRGYVDLGGGWRRTSRTVGFAFDQNNNEWGIRVNYMDGGKYLIEEIIYDRTGGGFVYTVQSKEELGKISLYSINKFLADVVASVINNAEQLW